MVFATNLLTVQITLFIGAKEKTLRVKNMRNLRHLNEPIVAHNIYTNLTYFFLTRPALFFYLCGVLVLNYQ